MKHEMEDEDALPKQKRITRKSKHRVPKPSYVPSGNVTPSEMECKNARPRRAHSRKIQLRFPKKM